MFQGAVRGEKRLWGTAADAQIVLWDSLGEHDKASCKEQMASNTKWVVWKSKETGQGKQKEEAWLNSEGVCIFQSPKINEKSSQEGQGSKVGTGRTVKTKGWWRRGDIQNGLNAKVMQCWVHKDAHTELSNKGGDHLQQSKVTNGTSSQRDLGGRRSQR